ncbi:DUF2845 domain-containing protein [Photobacterium sp. NCIMB 13483]|uniref:DUF2845 domain-containing protein n=1 Tax=Photobacterium TaxID=657 RepID=UPI000D16B399|nr:MULTISPECIES: DUF2845 domain-containing protein [Photobacterium]MCD9468958.1 hypothetical protein [Photobacterium iliopiscarium]MCD9539555.1 DUF2845 domain-containing protein [Photobacterium carnosum]MCF2164003.1 DUF2845 domain-containing protein [Photobacterium carnosum]PST87322.1 DUF2845 domain-containing protein [Photobacterium sp. NCIMB 13483]
MAKSKSEIQNIIYLIIIGLPIYAVVQAGESIGWGVITGVIAAGIVFYLWSKSNKTKKRREYLIDKYQDLSLVEDLMNQCFWVEQTADQLIDSLGYPVDVEQKMLKTKKKEVWKYSHQGGNRYSLRITLDNDHVVGWDQK